MYLLNTNCHVSKQHANFPSYANDNNNVQKKQTLLDQWNDSENIMHNMLLWKKSSRDQSAKGTEITALVTMQVVTTMAYYERPVVTFQLH